MAAPTKEKTEELDQELSQLRQERDKFDLEARTWADKRDALHEEIRNLRKEIGSLREKRDKLNEEVQQLKTLRENTRQQRNEKHAQIANVKEKIRSLEQKKPPRRMHQLEKEIENLEWKIQTTAYTLKEEKQLTDQVSVLEAQLLMHKQMQELENSLIELRAEEKAHQTKAQNHHERLSQLAEQSQKFHQQMTETSEKVRLLQKEADEAHQIYVENRQKARELNQKGKNLLEHVKTLRKKRHDFEEEKRRKRETELRKRLEETALEKLKRGEKLTWEEFKALSEKGVI